MTGEVLHDGVLVLAERDGLEPETWLLRQITGRDRPIKAPAVGKVVKGRFVNEEAEGDADIPDSALVELLRSEELGLEGSKWFRAAKETGISKGGFYVRLEKLIKEKAVLVTVSPEFRKIYGREVNVGVKWYNHPETLKETDPKDYERLMGAGAQGGGK